MLAPEPTCGNCKFGEEVPYDDSVIRCKRFPADEVKSFDDWCWEHPGKGAHPVRPVMEVPKVNGMEDVRNFVEEVKHRVRKSDKK